MARNVGDSIGFRIEKACEGLKEGVFFTDARGRILKANTAFYRLLGYSRQETEGLFFFDLASAGSPLLDDFKRSFHESFSLNYFSLAQDHRSLPIPLVKRDGRRITFEMESVVVPGEDGEPLFAMGILSPVNQEGFEENTSSAQAGSCFWELEQSHFGIIITDFSSRIARVNDRLVHMLGYASRDELLGRYLLELGPMSGTHLCTTGVKITIDQAHYQSQVACSTRLFQTGRANGTVYLFKKDGTVAPVEVALSLLTGGDGGCWGTMAICSDSTQRVKAEEEAFAAKEFLENIFASATDGMYVTDATGSFILVNDAFCEMTGCSRQELLGKYSPDMLPDPPDHVLTERDVEIQCLSNDFSCTETVWQRKSGEFFSVEVRLAVLRTDAGEESGLVVLVRDITERTRMAAALQRAQQELEQTVQERTASLAAMNTTLERVMQQVGEERKTLEKTLTENFEQFIFPYIERMKALRIDERQRSSLDVIEANLKNILNSFGQKTESYNHSLTQAEIQIANLIKQGLATKEIAKVTGLSVRTIDHRRESIRKKLGITDRTTSLSAYLLSLN